MSKKSTYQTPPSMTSLPHPTGSCTAVMGGMTKAMQAESALQAAAIHAKMIKVSSSTLAHGCVYGVTYPCSQEPLVREILSHAGLGVRHFM